ncbi:FHIP family protein AGAP011705 isoform X1 [Colias croceus]|uniref:FHIP family protein AGAP011705 isoform X1 n=1 Tax=Colias crocea TaxID=72248 RepID=UPI001E27DEDF|nr:FHIP family protein AGAP011705 isoform X1 [Colias croceus]XP_045503870.1 FHIP family protein AGAP011705 isoform X1 [Colias croceus]
MSWLRTTSMTLARQLSRSLDPRHDYEPQACYNSFCKHWQQALDIIVKSQPQHLHDDVLGVVNHLEQLATLLVLEARAREINQANSSSCLEYLLSENLLDKLYEWAICTGKYENAVRLEQLRLFGHLISHYSTQVIAAEPFLRPLLKLLSSFRNQLPPPNVESQLVSVLNQLCVTLMQNIKFIDLFFLMTHTQNGSKPEFIIGRLLLSSVHREGPTGAAARDAFLLCAKMSARCCQLAACLRAGNACPILATGLSGLYSLLPRTLGDNIHRLTPDDVNKVHKLTLFIDSLEFCNAVAQVADPSIKTQLLDLLYQGFLVPVMGPALLQTKDRSLQAGGAEQTAATAYFELVLRCITTGGLLRVVLHFLFTCEYDGVKVIDVLLARLEGSSQLSLVTLSLMETLIDLNCEDVMIELIFKYLLNGHHLISHKHKLADPENFREAAIAFLDLQPKCCERPLACTRQWVDDMALSGKRVLDLRPGEESRVNGMHGDIAMNNLVQEVCFDYGNPNETLIGNYHAYLSDSRVEIVTRTIACSNWTSKYVTIAKREPNNNTKDKEIEITPTEDSLVSICTSGYETFKTSDTSEKEHSLNSLVEEKEEEKEIGLEKEEGIKEHDSLTSFGESSGYDSFKYREECEGFAEDSFRKSFDKGGDDGSDCEVPVRSWRINVETIIGPLLAQLLKKVSLLLESDVATNCRVTSVIYKLCSFPAPLLVSLLLCPAFILPNLPTLYQILNKLREEIDELLEGMDNIPELVDMARVFLIQREMALVRRALSNDDNKAQKAQTDTFQRTESKRRSLSSSFSNMFGRKVPPSPPQVSMNYTPLHTQKRPAFTQESYWNQSIKLRAILNAVILDEWLKELSSLCQEQALRLSAEYYEDESFIRTLAL